MKNLPVKLIKTLFILFVVTLLRVPYCYAEDEITIRDIKEIPLDELGILTPQNGGLKKTTWYGSDRGFSEGLLILLPVQTKSEIAKSLINPILLSSATPPILGDALVKSVFEIKLKLLAKLGDYENITQMIRLVPPERITEEMNQIFVSSSFIGGDYKKACTDSNYFLKNHNSLFWREIQIICDSYEKKQENVDFNLKLLEEDGQTLSAPYQDVLKSFAANKNKAAKKQLSLILNESILKTPEILTDFPDLSQINQSNLDKKQIEDWLKKNKDIPNEKRISQTVNLFANIDALEKGLHTNYWRQFILFAVSKNIPIPHYAAFKLLEETTSGGEKILTIVHLLDKTSPEEIPQYLLIKVISSLYQIGFKKEAALLSQEAAF